MNNQETAYIQFFLNRRKSVFQIDGLELSHPSFSKTHYLLHRHRRSIVLRHEDGQSAVYEYLPMRWTPMGARSDLDYGIQVVLGDLGDIIPEEIDRCRRANAMHIRPTAKFRSWRSDNLSAPMVPASRLEVGEISRNKEGSTFVAMAPRLNLVRTGQSYDTDRFPMLSAFR